MLIAKLGEDPPEDGPEVWILGLDEINVHRLTHGKPIVAQLGKLQPGAPTICISYGQTLDQIKRDLVQAFGPLPPEETLPR